MEIYVQQLNYITLKHGGNPATRLIH